jgi:dTDP-4-dehydrorhamnose 3,5-epimerase
MNIIKTALDGVLVVVPKIHIDTRGHFFENYNNHDFQALGLPYKFVQDNHVFSNNRVLRGLHYQVQYPQGKLVRVTQGSVYDVAVDIRLGSPTFGAYMGLELTAENKNMLFVPEGFAHGYQVISDTAEVQYKCTQLYHPDDDFGIAWSDPEIQINWPLDNPLLSAKDKKLPDLKNVPDDLLPVYGKNL